MSGFGLLLSVLVIPSIRREVDSVEDEKKAPWTASTVLARFNPIRVFKLLLRPNILLAVSLCVGFISIALLT